MRREAGPHEPGRVSGLTDLIVAPTLELLVPRVIEWLQREIGAAIAQRSLCSICLAGGRTPAPLYRRLAEAPVDWTRVVVYFSDERAVSPDHLDSNYHMLWETLLSRIPIPSSQVHRMEAERSDREAAAADYARSLPARLDILLLGMGSDGHTASLFPGSPALDEKRLVVPVVGSKPPVHRTSITPVVIEAARQVAVLSTGLAKAAMVREALEGRFTPSLIPVQLARRGTWFLDQAAASQLSSRRTPA